MIASEVSGSSNMVNTTVASHGESTLYDIVSVPRGTGEQAFKKENASFPSPKVVRSASRRSHRRADNPNIYQLSSDLREKAIECLENKYGGKEQANKAARVIQHHYRRWIMHRSFKRMRAFSDRKNSLTRAPGSYFKKIIQSSLVFYGPDNPVMIVDDNENCPIDTRLSTSSSDSEAPSSDTIDVSNCDLSDNLSEIVAVNKFIDIQDNETIYEEAESTSVEEKVSFFFHN